MRNKSFKANGIKTHAQKVFYRRMNLKKEAEQDEQCGRQHHGYG
jgi:hypothetical protein